MSTSPADIRGLRILPPLAIGRLGAADAPLDNFELTVEPTDPLGFRRIVPADSFDIDPATGEIVGVHRPETLVFARDGKARPVAPFLEVWAQTGDDVLEPLTETLLAAHGLTPGDVHWRVVVGNHKVFRRTGAAADKVDASVGPFSDHAAHALEGQCANFWPGKVLPLGWARYIKPTSDFPGIRLRFTPARGYVYGSSTDPPPGGPPGDPNIVEVLYDASPGHGTWLGFADSATDPAHTNPYFIYAGHVDKDGNQISAGYLDDECDGLVHVELTVGGRALSAFARIGAGPPAYAPDSLPVRTVADELEQALFGPDIEPADATLERAEEIVRRALETVRLMNTEVMNGNTIDGRVDVASTMVRQDTGDTGRYFEPIMATTIVDNLALLNLHQNILTALRAGTAPWFADVLREPEEMADLSAKGRRKMPALMRGADGRSLTLTRRQINLIKTLARGPVAPDPSGTPAPTATPAAGRNAPSISPRNLSAQLSYRAAGNPTNTLPDSAISNCFPGLEFDFRNIWRRIFAGIVLHESDNYVVAAEGNLQHLAGRRLLTVAGQPVVAQAVGPQSPAGPSGPLANPGSPNGAWAMEWSNALANVLSTHAGRKVVCGFTKGPAPVPVAVPPPEGMDHIELEIRPLFASDSSGEALAVIDEALVDPGDLTQSLCSPWQNDYRECACYYWAASRPDYVDVEADPGGASTGLMWFAKHDEPRTYVLDDRKDSRLLSYDDLFRDWQGRLRFVVGGQRVEDEAP